VKKVLTMLTLTLVLLLPTEAIPANGGDRPTLEPRVTRLEHKVRRLRTHVRHLEGRANGLESDIEWLDERLDALEGI
jgi:hypothetical protein